MADNAPFSVNRPPYPNEHINLPGRLETYVATIALNGASAPSLVNGASSAGVTVTDTATGRVTVNFPPGGTGAIGFVLISPMASATPDASAAFALDSDLTNYATGVIEISHFAADDNDTGDDLTGEITVLITVLKAVS